MRAAGQGAILVCAAWLAGCASERPEPAPVAAVTTDRGSLALLRDEDGNGRLRHTTPDGLTRDVPCERLQGAWGMWVDDVDGDGRREVLIALRKAARHDPRVENRLHVYALEGGRCVPVWRGTRLAGRFDDLALEAGAPGTLLALERVGTRRRIARYRWSDFGYALDTVLFDGEESPPPELAERFAPLEESP